MEFQKQVQFKNWTDKRFIYKFDGKSYGFEPGKTYSLPDTIALHFAKHLAEKAWFDDPKNNVKETILPRNILEDWMDKCLVNSSVSAIKATLPVSMVEENVEEEPTEILSFQEVNVETPVEEVKAEPISQEEPAKKGKSTKKPNTLDGEYVK